MTPNTKLQFANYVQIFVVTGEIHTFMGTNSNKRTLINATSDMNTTSIRANQAKSKSYQTKYTELNKTYQAKPSKAIKAKPQNFIHKP